MVQGMMSLLGEERCLLRTTPENLIAMIDDSVAVVLLSHINYRSGQIHDMKSITRRAHDCGAMVIWDLAHSAGAIPIGLDEACVDFAVGCGYKFLNGGPGAPAFLYAAKRHQDKCDQALSGWMGHQSPFEFSSKYLPGQGILRYLCGTPSVIAMSSLYAALDVFSDVDIHALREKSLLMSDFLIECVDASSELSELSLLSPRDRAIRGSQVSFCHPFAYEICQALIAINIIPDFRAPDILRFGITPLYSRFEDIAVLVDALKNILSAKIFEQERFAVKRDVT